MRAVIADPSTGYRHPSLRPRRMRIPRERVRSLYDYFELPRISHLHRYTSQLAVHRHCGGGQRASAVR